MDWMQGLHWTLMAFFGGMALMTLLDMTWFYRHQIAELVRLNWSLFWAEVWWWTHQESAEETRLRSLKDKRSA